MKGEEDRGWMEEDRMFYLRFELLDLLRGVAVVPLLLARVLVAVEVVTGGSVQVVAPPGSALVLVLLVPSHRVPVSAPRSAAAAASDAHNSHAIHLSLHVQVRLLLNENRNS